MADSTALNTGVVGESRRSRRLRAAIRPWLIPKVAVGVTIVAMLVIAGAFAPWLAPYDPNGQNLSRVLRPPQWLSGPHVLGTDAVGRDILSRLFYGARISLVIAIMVVIISGVVGLILGAVSGYFAKTTDFVIQKFVEVVWAFPPLLLAIAIMAFLGQGLGNLILALVSQRWIAYCRVSRGQALSLRSREFVEAARSLGAGHTRIIMRHILPNCVGPIVVFMTLIIAAAILIEAALSFLGFGIQPPNAALGSLIDDGQEQGLETWWLVTFPGLVIVVIALCVNFIGDGLRDALDPTQRRTR